MLKKYNKHDLYTVNYYLGIFASVVPVGGRAEKLSHRVRTSLPQACFSPYLNLSLPIGQFFFL